MGKRTMLGDAVGVNTTGVILPCLFVVFACVNGIPLCVSPFEVPVGINKYR